MNAIETKNITKRYNDKLVVDNISMEVKPGDIFGLIGPNGAGKTTLINMIVGLVSIDKGEASIEGADVVTRPEKSRMHLGVVPQNLALLKDMSAVDNLEFFGSYYGLFGKELKARVAEVLDIIGLTEKKNDKVKTYSGGMMRRLNLGCAILHHPSILILDEPTVGVDAQSRNYIFDYLRRINAEGTTILYTSHYMEEIEALCNRILIIDGGKVISYGAKEDIKRMFGGRKTVRVSTEEDKILDFLDLRGVKQQKKTEAGYELEVEGDQFRAEELISYLHSRDSSLKSLNIDDPSLEEIFLALTGKNLRD